MSREEMTRSRYFFRLAETFLLSVFHLTDLLFRFLPPRAMDAFFSLLGKLIFYARPGMRRRLIAKIAQAMPEITDERELNRIAKEACTSALRPIYDLFLFGNHGESFMRHLRVEGMENLELAAARGKGVLFLGAHLGAYSVRLPVMAKLGEPYTPVMYHPDDSPVAGYVKAMAIYGSSLGYDAVDNAVIFAGDNTISRIEERLSRGGKVCVNFDVDGEFIVDFFGRPAAMASGIAHFALNTEAAIVPFALLRGDEVFDHHMKIFEPLDYGLSGEPRKDLASIMEKVMDAGQNMIREDPGQWMSWFGIWHWWDKAAQRLN
ncbi:MAG: hypothetical protein JW854_03715 [Actinobacteria bacterium]|nr:hypothetical protein [Actinomycetota bacterium]